MPPRIPIARKWMSMNQQTSFQYSITESIQKRDFDAISLAGSAAVIPLLHASRQRNRVLGQWAYQALRRLGKRAVPGLIRALSDPSALVRRDAAHALERISDRDATEALIHMLHDDDINVRIRAVQALGQLHDERAVGPLVHLLDDPNRAIAHHTTNVLTGMGMPAALLLLQTLQDHGQDEIVRWRSARALRFFRTPEVRDCLIQILTDQSQPSYVRQGAAAGLVHFDSNQIIEMLITVLADRDGAVRASVAHALGENARYAKGLVDKRPVEPLIRVLTEDNEPRARWMAALALPFFDDERALPALLRLRRIPATSIDDKRIKEAAGFAVRNMRRIARRRADTMSVTQRDANVP
jgi:HEAT repeat protein